LPFRWVRRQLDGRIIQCGLVRPERLLEIASVAHIGK
jgi:hypothetical protein